MLRYNVFGYGLPFDRPNFFARPQGAGGAIAPPLRLRSRGLRRWSLGLVALATRLRENPTGPVRFGAGAVAVGLDSRRAESPPENRVRGKTGRKRAIYGVSESVATTPTGPQIGPIGKGDAISKSRRRGGFGDRGPPRASRR